MNIIARVYSCNIEKYRTFYKDAVKKAFLKDNILINTNDIRIQIKDLSENGTRNIQSQRAPLGEHNRSITVLVDGEIKYIIGISNTNYDDDKLLESNRLGTKNTYGVFNYHSNSYLCQGINKIFEYYFDMKKDNQNIKLFFYLLDVEESYPHNISNLVNYRKLYTLGFQILNIEKISLGNYGERGHLDIENMGYESFNKLMNDMLYVSRRNNGNLPGYLQCVDLDYDINLENQREDRDIYYTIQDLNNKKYIYTFKTLGAESYDSFLTMWTLIELAKRENKNLEFLFAPEKYNFRLDTGNEKMTEDFPTTITRLFQKIGLDVKYETSEEIRQQFERETTQYEISKKNNTLRNQELFKNNLRRKGIQTKCYLCGCEIENILEAAHLWSIADIKNATASTINETIKKDSMNGLIDENNAHKNELFYKRYVMANSGDNGVWLCSNHHGLFDRNYYCFNYHDGKVILKDNLNDITKNFISEITSNNQLPQEVLSERTKEFLKRRKESFDCA